jgi:hypothetical protein
VVKLLCDTPAKRQSAHFEAQEASARQTYSLRLRFTKNTSPRLLDVLVRHTGSQWQGPNNNIPTRGVGHELLVRERAEPSFYFVAHRSTPDLFGHYEDKTGWRRSISRVKLGNKKLRR